MQCPWAHSADGETEDKRGRMCSDQASPWNWETGLEARPGGPMTFPPGPRSRFCEIWGSTGALGLPRCRRDSDGPVFWARWSWGRSGRGWRAGGTLEWWVRGGRATAGGLRELLPPDLAQTPGRPPLSPGRHPVPPDPGLGGHNSSGDSGRSPVWSLPPGQVGPLEWRPRAGRDLGPATSSLWGQNLPPGR